MMGGFTEDSIVTVNIEDYFVNIPAEMRNGPSPWLINSKTSKTLKKKFQAPADRFQLNL